MPQFSSCGKRVHAAQSSLVTQPTMPCVELTTAGWPVLNAVWFVES
jgi:hypothetical protein